MNVIHYVRGRKLKIITEPSVYLISRPALDREALQQFFADNDITYTTEGQSDGEDLCVVAGRNCYRSYSNPRPGGNSVYLRNIIESQHGSVLAHAYYVFQVTGVSRSLSHELIRHSAGTSVSELSQRYVDCSDIAVVVPPAMVKYKLLWDKHGQGYAKLASPFSRWIDARQDELNEYDEWTTRLLADAPADLPATEKRKWARQAARNCLPNSAETWLTFGGNLRAWRNIIEQRCSRHADAEIRRLLNVIYDQLLLECPNVFSDYQKHQLPDGTFELTTIYTKV